jgi:hypothetical protein
MMIMMTIDSLMVLINVIILQLLIKTRMLVLIIANEDGNRGDNDMIK